MKPQAQQSRSAIAQGASACRTHLRSVSDRGSSGSSSGAWRCATTRSGACTRRATNSIDAATEEALAEALRRTGSVPIACRGAGITPRLFEQALAGDEPLRDPLEHALLDGYAWIDEEIYTRAFCG